MSQKYPSAKTPYRYTRKPLATCCTTRLGTVKKRFDTEKQANKTLKKFDGSYSVYPCEQGKGYHIRTNRGLKHGK